MIVPSYKPAYYYGGPIYSIAALCEGFEALGNDVTVYTTNANGAQSLAVQTGVPVIVDGVQVNYFRRITGDHSHFSPALLWHLIRHIHKYDVIHIQSWWNMVAIPAALICLVKGITPVISPRGSLTSYTFTHRRTGMKTMLHTLIGKHLLKRSVLHFTSKREQQESSSIVSGLKDYIIPNLVVLENQIRPPQQEKSIFTILFLGRIDPAKNIELLLSVFSDPFPFPVELKIAGNGEDEYIRTLKRQQHPEGAIQWLGHIEGEEKQRLLASADLLVLPSHTENYGNVVIESLWQGTPVLISEGVGLKEFVREHNLGWVSEESPEAWRKHIVEIYYDATSRADIRHRATGVLRTVLDDSSLLRQYEEMYNYIGTV